MSPHVLEEVRQVGSSARSYQKPTLLCEPSPVTSTGEMEAFVRQQKAQLRGAVAQQEGQLRLAEVEDIPAIRGLIEQVSGSKVLAQISTSDLYRTVTYGFIPLIETLDGELLSFNAMDVFADKYRTAVTVFVATSLQARTKGLAVLISRYSSLLAMEVGCRVKRTWIAPGNEQSLKNHLNHEGYLLDGIYPHLYQPSTLRLTVALALTPEGLLNNSINLNKVEAYLESDPTARCIDHDDFGEMQLLLRGGTYKIVALLPASFTESTAQFLAVRTDRFDHYSLANP